jgi:flavin reductase (DIM6/NTAB) family NADH-FMN oxidoreductase RutF
MLTFNPSEIATRDLHQFLVGAVAPRPIAFVSTVDEEGNPNLAPYSFFNCFSSNPPILVFSSNRRVTNNTTKDTLANVMATKQCVINVVSHSFVGQMSIASVEFPTEVNEWEKSGLTPVESELIKPARVKESPVQMECQVSEIIPLGEKGGAGHLIICHVVKMHIDKNILDENGRIDPVKIDLVGRLGRSYYTHVNEKSLFTLVQPVTKNAIGFDQLPSNLLSSHVLTSNDLATIAGLESYPSGKDLEEMLMQHQDLRNWEHTRENTDAFHRYLKTLIDEHRVDEAAELALWWEELG